LLVRSELAGVLSNRVSIEKARKHSFAGFCILAYLQ
jgi:hypothetical protein